MTPRSPTARTRIILTLALLQMSLAGASVGPARTAAPDAPPPGVSVMVALSPAQVAALLDRGQSQQAEAAAREILKVKPGSAKALRMLAQAQAQQGQMEAARITLAEAITYDPSAGDFEVISPDEARRLIASNPGLALKLLREVQLVKPGEQVDALIAQAEAAANPAGSAGPSAATGAATGATTGATTGVGEAAQAPGDLRDVAAAEAALAARSGAAQDQDRRRGEFLRALLILSGLAGLVALGAWMLSRRGQQRAARERRQEVLTWYAQRAELIETTLLDVRIKAINPKEFPRAPEVEGHLTDLLIKQGELRDTLLTSDRKLPALAGLRQELAEHAAWASETAEQRMEAARQRDQARAEDKARTEAALRSAREESTREESTREESARQKRPREERSPQRSPRTPEPQQRPAPPRVIQSAPPARTVIHEIHHDQSGLTAALITHDLLTQQRLEEQRREAQRLEEQRREDQRREDQRREEQRREDERQEEVRRTSQSSWSEPEPEVHRSSQSSWSSSSSDSWSSSSSDTSSSSSDSGSASSNSGDW